MNAVNGVNGVNRGKRNGRWDVFIFSLIFLLPVLCPSAVHAGTIKGKVISKKSDSRRVMQRYPGKQQQITGELEPIPAVIMILGPVNGFPPPPPPKPAQIVQKDLKFHPPLLVVPVDTEVSFPNQDLEFHNVFSYSKTKRFDLGRYHKGESKSVRFTKPGIGKIYCEIHQWMRAAVVVIENPFYTSADENGNFEIKNVPKGAYKLLIWKIDHKKAVKEITVTEKGTVELTVTLPEKKIRQGKIK